ncbi:hypothetical protein ATY41_05785 [Leifsonia xyli subsp. xyli]|uniref:Uncharacterized protein n=1 Tax=Leifsonia xyli subsp. xyli TaxID=59736 RepID=A0A1E2SI45_LEIXY|nr:hypothetical protein ATY41_05785 [Leifsonia xyli subsp. xyli]
MHVVNRCRSFVRSLVRFGRGDTPAALSASQESLDEALALLDHSAILLHSYVRVLALLDSGRWREALKIIDQALAYGAPSPIEAGLYKALLHGGAFLNGLAHAAHVLLAVDRTTGLVGQVLDVLTVGLPTLVPCGRERLAHRVPLHVVELHEQLGPTVLDVKRLHDGLPSRGLSIPFDRASRKRSIECFGPNRFRVWVSGRESSACRRRRRRRPSRPANDRYRGKQTGVP